MREGGGLRRTDRPRRSVAGDAVARCCGRWSTPDGKALDILESLLYSSGRKPPPWRQIHGRFALHRFRSFHQEVDMKSIGWLLLRRWSRGFLLTFGFLWTGSSGRRRRIGGRTSRAGSQVTATVLSNSIGRPRHPHPRPGATRRRRPASARNCYRRTPSPTPIPGETLVYFVPTDSDATATVLIPVQHRLCRPHRRPARLQLQRSFGVFPQHHCPRRPAFCACPAIPSRLLPRPVGPPLPRSSPISPISPTSPACRCPGA